jgi:hypothetical protein
LRILSSIPVFSLFADFAQFFRFVDHAPKTGAEAPNHGVLGNAKRAEKAGTGGWP